MPHPSLPEELGDRFAVAEAVRLGVSRSRLRTRDLARPFHGVRSVFDEGLDRTDRWGSERGAIEREHLRRAREYATRMSEREFFSHITAAVIWGLPLPIGAIAGRPIDVGVMAPYRLPRGAGVRGHQARSARTSVRRDPFTGLLVAGPVTTWAMLGSVLVDSYDLVAAGDGVVRNWRREEPLATVGQLDAALATGRRIGGPALRQAMPLIRTRAASRPETWTRLTLVDAGLPEPHLNWDVWDNGIRIACVDHAYPDLKIAIEYEGAHHLLDTGQWNADIDRYERLVAAGWLVIRVTKEELFGHPARLVTRVRRAIAARVSA